MEEAWENNDVKGKCPKYCLWLGKVRRPHNFICGELSLRASVIDHRHCVCGVKTSTELNKAAMAEIAILWIIKDRDQHRKRLNVWMGRESTRGVWSKGG